MNDIDIQYYVQKRREGWDNSEVRNEIQELGYSKEDVSYYLNRIDDEFVHTVNERSDLTVENLTTRIVELVVGLVLLIIGLFFASLCIKYGPGLLSILIAFIGISSGYYFSKRGLKGLINIRKTEKKRALIKKEEDVLDN